MKNFIYLFLMTFCFCCVSSIAPGQEGSFKGSVLEVTDVENHAKYSLSFLKDKEDKGVYAVVVKMENTSTNKSLSFDINGDESTTFMITIRDDKGEMLSEPVKIFASYEKQTFKTISIASNKTLQWTLPIASRLKDTLSQKEISNCRVQVGIVVQSHPVKVINLYSTDIMLTRRSLAMHK